MKKCPRCGKTYPDSEAFCEEDGVALTPGAGNPPPPGRATTVMTDDPALAPESAAIECPVCGGKAQPGEVICNFCGTRLVPEGAETRPGAASARVSPENFVPSSDRSRSRGFASAPAETLEEEDEARSIFGVVGFVFAALIALALGAWLAIHLSSTRPVAQNSPSPAAVSSPVVTIASSIPLQVSGDGAGTPPRDAKTLAQFFDSHKADLADIYRRTLDADPSFSDGLLLRVHIAPDGTVTDGSVRTSTSSNPSLDAEVVKTTTGWKYDAANGTNVDAEYPIILANKAADASTIESQLRTKIASLGPNEAPEYALSPASPSPIAAASGAAPEGAPSPASSPAVASAPSGAAPAVGETPSPRKHRPTRMAALPPPKPPLLERVNDELKANRKLRRVQAYTNGGNVTIFGKVFDDDAKRLAENTVRGVSGVTSVTNNLTTDVQDWQQNTNRINQQLQSAGLSGVTAKVIGKTAYLSGSVKTDVDKERAVTVAQAAAPVIVRENLIRVEPGSMFGF